MRIIRYMDSFSKQSFACLNDDGSAAKISGNFDDYTVTDEPADVQRLLAPIDPKMILAIGMNYKEHIEETGKETPKHPVLFMKSPSAVQDPGGAIVLPQALEASGESVDYEAELAVIIGRNCKNVRSEEALDYVLGYTCANDVSARNWQFEHGGGQFCRAKSFDTFCPLGPCLVTKESIPDPQKLKIRTIINNEILQEGNTANMLFSVAELIAFLSADTTLPAGAVILTGTPSGVGVARNPQRFLKVGDSVCVEIEGIGKLENQVMDFSADEVED